MGAKWVDVLRLVRFLEGAGVELHRGGDVREKILCVVAARINVEFVFHMKGIEFVVQSPGALVEAIAVFAATIEVNLEPGYSAAFFLARTKGLF